MRIRQNIRISPTGVIHAYLHVIIPIAASLEAPFEILMLHASRTVYQSNEQEGAGHEIDHMNKSQSR